METKTLFVSEPLAKETVQNKFSAQVVFKHPASQIIAINFREGDTMPPHTAPSDVWVTVLEGNMEITIEQKNHLLRKGDYLSFLPNQLHALRALSDARILVFKMN